MSERTGLPLELEKETYEAVKGIFHKYMAMKKKHLNQDRIRGIMTIAFAKAFYGPPPGSKD